MVRVVPIPVIALVPFVSLNGGEQLGRFNDDGERLTWLFVPVDVVFHSPYLLLGISGSLGRGRVQGASLCITTFVAHYIGPVMCIHCYRQARTSRLTPFRQGTGSPVDFQKRAAYVASSRVSLNLVDPAYDLSVSPSRRLMAALAVRAAFLTYAKIVPSPPITSPLECQLSRTGTFVAKPTRILKAEAKHPIGGLAS